MISASLNAKHVGPFRRWAIAADHSSQFMPETTFIIL